MEVWNSGQRVMTQMPRGEHVEGEDARPKQATPEPSECKHGSVLKQEILGRTNQLLSLQFEYLIVKLETISVCVMKHIVQMA
jgi:hypothetical protein